MISSCFPHVVNLCCKAVLGAITDLKFAEEMAADYECSGDVPQTFEETLKRDPIATTRSLIRGVCQKAFTPQHYRSTDYSTQI